MPLNSCNECTITEVMCHRNSEVQVRFCRLTVTLAIFSTLVACRSSEPSGPPDSSTTARLLGDSTVAFGIAVGVNESGNVAGYFTKKGSGASRERAFFWSSSGGFRDLGTLGLTSENVRATGLNDSNEVVGYAGTRAFLWSSSQAMRDIGLPAGAISGGATAISNSGRVVGFWRATTLFSGRRAFAWSDIKGMQPLSVPAGFQDVVAYAINSRGQTVGDGCVSPCSVLTLPTRALIWEADGSSRALPTPPDVQFSTAKGIDDRGRVVGTVRFADGSTRAVLWSESGTLRELGMLAGTGASQAYAIGAGGHVVGESGLRPFIWTDATGMRDLDPPSVAVLPRVIGMAYGITRFGMAVGALARTPDSHLPAVFASPR